MTAFSLGTVWEETIAYLRRESSLLIPVALAIFGPAQVMLGLAMTATAEVQKAPVTPSLTSLLIIPASLLVMFGNIAIAVIVLSPGIRIGEALSRAGRALPRALLAILLLGLAIAVAAMIVGVVATVGAVMLGVNPKSPSIGGPLIALMSIPMFVLMVRMLLLAPVAAAEKLKPVELIRRSWDLGKGNVLRFAALWLLAMFLSFLVGAIERFVLGSIVELLKLAISEHEILEVIQLVIKAGIESLLALAMAVYLAFVYRKIATG